MKKAELNYVPVRAEDKAEGMVFVPAWTVVYTGPEEDSESYGNTSLKCLCEFVNIQFDYWTKNEFALYFRRMITLEQYKNEEMKKLYRDMLASGPVKYSEDLFREMIKNGRLNGKAAKIGAKCLAIQLYAPLHLALQLYDTNENDCKKIKRDLKMITKDFEERWK